MILHFSWGTNGSKSHFSWGTNALKLHFSWGTCCIKDARLCVSTRYANYELCIINYALRYISPNIQLSCQVCELVHVDLILWRLQIGIVGDNVDRRVTRTH